MSKVTSIFEIKDHKQTALSVSETLPAGLKAGRDAKCTTSQMDYTFCVISFYILQVLSRGAIVMQGFKQIKFKDQSGMYRLAQIMSS